MLFNSLSFFFFFPIVTLLYFLLPHRFRWLLLLAASCFFYMLFIPKYIFILALTIVVDYFAAIKMEKAVEKKRTAWFVVSIISTCSILFYFKYYDFFAANVNDLARFLHWNYSIGALSIILPIGLSFHTFQSLSYVIEVYRGHQKAEHHFGIYALYVMFYPQLVAGPIERPQNLLGQFYRKHEFDYQRVTSGLRLMAWGLFKKVVVADRLAAFVTPVYNNPGAHFGPTLLLATLCFSFQVYGDFSGYSDIAIGAARVMGFKLMDNFNRPYAARTLADFWKRWHISLSSWLRDYIYDPIAIGFRHLGMAGVILGLVTTFFISGLWHGASWTFVVWGLLHGCALSLEALSAKPRRRLAKRMPAWLFNGVSVLVTFSFVSFTYIFFRAKTIADALYVAGHLFNGFSWGGISLSIKKVLLLGQEPYLGFSRGECWVAIAAVAFMEGAQYLWSHRRPALNIENSPLWLRWAGYYALVFSLVILGVWFSKRDFIYFQF